jgi:cytochrome c oxidase subunit 2
VALPLVVLTAHLVMGLSILPGMLAPAPAESLSVEVMGAQWWWRVRYMRPGQEPVELANELRLPVNQRVNVHLTSRDVIHSFWVPRIAGKLDLIPGRRNRLPLEPTRTGVYRGACAEFCGTSHARMNFMVVVSEPGEFETWLSAQALPAALPADTESARGAALFLERGCAACHTVRGTAAQGRVGPDLTHLASRHTIAAGTLPFTPADLQRWITQTTTVKPGAHMPPFALEPADLQAVTSYLTSLK